MNGLMIGRGYPSTDDAIITQSLKFRTIVCKSFCSVNTETIQYGHGNICTVTSRNRLTNILQITVQYD